MHRHAGYPAVFETEPARPDFLERLKSRGGYQRHFGFDAKFQFEGPRTGLESTLDFGNDFGRDEGDNLLRERALSLNNGSCYWIFLAW